MMARDNTSRGTRRAPARSAGSAQRPAARSQIQNRGLSQHQMQSARSNSRRRVQRASGLDRARSRFVALKDFVGAHRFLSAVIAVILVSFIFLAAPVRDYYVSVRTKEVLQQSYSELTAENESLEQDLDRLQTSEGIQDEARKRGYVAEGETAVTVTGQITTDTEESDPSAPETYNDTRDLKTRILDIIFGFDPESVLQ